MTLKPDFAEVTLKVDADAEIWVNNEKKGVRTWTGPLGKGTYKIECKQESHETSMISKEITTEMNGQIITLPAPTPIYGSLNVESTPFGATIYIDGKEVGKTPKPINEILVGEHEIKLVKDGYKTHTETVTITKDKKLVKITLDSDVSILPLTTPQQPEAKKHVDNKIFIMANAAYSFVPQTSFGVTVGSVKKLGWYVSFGTNFNFSNSFDYECNGNGEISSDITDYKYTGEQKTSRLAATAGMVIRMSNPVYAYLGGGYGYRNLFWQFYDCNNNNGWAKNVDYSYQGLSLDAGLMLNFSNVCFSIGVQTTGFNYFETKTGVGVIF